MQYSYSRSADPRALGKSPNHLTKWQTATSTITELVEFAYVQGRAFAHGIFDLDAPLVEPEKTHKNNRLWLGSELMVLDIDDAPDYTLNQIKALPFVQEYAAAIFPSSSYAPDKLRVHVIFALNKRVTSHAQYREIGSWQMEQFPFKTDSVTRMPSIATYGTVFLNDAMLGHVKALDDGLCWINDAAKPIDVFSVLAERIATGAFDPTKASLEHEAGQAVDNSDGDLPQRVQNHLSASPEKQTEVVLEALSYALKSDWSERDRYGRMPLIMSAFAGSNDTAVRDAFLNHSGSAWDNSTQKEMFAEWWKHHVPRKGGINVSLLFREARKHGWLQRSSVELTNAIQIYVEEVSDWLLSEDLPARILLKSPTGTGKTKAAIALLKKMDNPKAVFFAPSIKLCMNLSASLTKAGVENTLYLDHGRKTKDAETLKKAQVLVTTLQTFAVKAFSSGVKIQDYDLVVMDECDEMISGFVRSGIGGKLAAPSHVDKTQARLGMDALASIFAKAKRVLLLDGTATELSRYVMESWSPKGSTGVYENTFSREKAPVSVYSHLGGLRDDIVTQVMLGKKIVVACDTKAEANLIETLLVLTEAASREEILRVTADTAADARVNDFFKDVEKGAQDYRVVIYNSAMGSGVSIEQTEPDILYLISTYLAPRKLIQLINRYRRQREVRAFIQWRESLYAQNVAERYLTLNAAVKIEEALSGLAMGERAENAVVVSNAALIAATDEYEQNRSVRDFFDRLLKDERREVVYQWSEDSVYEEETKEARALIEAGKAEIKETWRRVPPIKRGDGFPSGISAEDAARGLLHGLIDEAFPGIEERVTDLTDGDIADLALRFNRKRGVIKRWLDPSGIMATAVDEMQNRRKETVAFRLYFARVELITLLNILWPDAYECYGDEELDFRAKEFNAEIKKRSSIYDVVAASQHKFKTVDKADLTAREKALIYANNILKSIGLSTKRKNGKRTSGEARERASYISGLSDLHSYAILAGHAYDSEALRMFNRPQFLAVVDQAQKTSKDFSKLSPSEQTDVLETLTIVDRVGFGEAVSAVQGRRFAS